MPTITTRRSVRSRTAVSGGGAFWFATDDTQPGLAHTRHDSNHGNPSDTTHIVTRQNKLSTRDTIDLGIGLFKQSDPYGGHADYKHQEVEPDGTADTIFRNKKFDRWDELLPNPIGPIRSTALGMEVQCRRFSAVGNEENYMLPALPQSEAAYLFTGPPLGPAVRVQTSGRVAHTPWT